MTVLTVFVFLFGGGETRQQHHEDYMPKVAIGLPVFNGADYLEAAITSILGQTFGDFELLISDNASGDKTEEICRHYVGQDPRPVRTTGAQYRRCQQPQLLGPADREPVLQVGSARRCSGAALSRGFRGDARRAAGRSAGVPSLRSDR